MYNSIKKNNCMLNQVDYTQPGKMVGSVMVLNHQIISYKMLPSKMQRYLRIYFLLYNLFVMDMKTKTNLES